MVFWRDNGPSPKEQRWYSAAYYGLGLMPAVLVGLAVFACGVLAFLALETGDTITAEDVQRLRDILPAAGK